MKYAQIVLPIALDKSFDYHIPSNLVKKIDQGSVVKVPFGKRLQIGYCVGLSGETDISKNKLKDIKAVIEDIPPITGEIMKLTRWMSDYYFCSWGEALEATLPSGVRKGQGKVRPKEFSENYLSDNVEKKNPFKPTSRQANAINKIKQVLGGQKSEVFLLHGITGSGKTEVYLQVIDKAIKQNKQAIVLVPEISLTPQTVSRFRERFDRIAVLHSYLTSGQRANQWRKIRAGEIDVVIGARSAVFAPTQNLGVIVIDEEYESSFKQESTPRYHARTVAVKRAQLEKAVVILGSATPSLETYYFAKCGDYQYLELPERIERRLLPAVEIIDMIQQKGSKGNTLAISKPLEIAIRESLDRNEQVILFLNRRGYITLVTCPKCKHIVRCKHCQVALTYHKNIDKMLCHHCDKEISYPKVCPECGYGKLSKLGMGTERIEEYVNNLFGKSKQKRLSRINRFDSDSMRFRESGRDALDTLSKGEADILIGTQLVAKGLDFPNVTLVGIISADTALYLKDFRSAERTFNLITQVAGRTGRGEKGGRVIAQTLNPSHYSIVHAAKQDYHSFAQEELKYRKEFSYPPYSYLLRILLEGGNESKVKQYAEKLFTKIKNYKQIEILGPAPCAWVRIRKKYRWHIVVKAKDSIILQSFYQAYRKDLSFGSKAIKTTLDIDPLALL